ncbi:hypothetical protein FIBSPDRAFT_860041 [Athelia psychrophila]|nr:hypothetical protein FIBSPDRAFT_860041 [Fibularhizoctonia sp. CBS 109695]
MEVGATQFPSLTRLCGWPDLASRHLLELSRAFPFLEEIYAVQWSSECTWGTTIQRLTNSPHWSRLHTLGIAGIQLNDESLLSLDRRTVHSVKRLVLSPELVEEARGYILGAALPFEVANISLSTPFPLTGLDKVPWN